MHRIQAKRQCREQSGNGKNGWSLKCCTWLLEIINKNEPDKYLREKPSLQGPGIKETGGYLELRTKWEAHCLSQPYRVQGDAASGLYDTKV